MAHYLFRKKMGFNDASDAKRSHMGLSKRQYMRQPQKLTAKSLEDLHINGYANYLLDPNCPIEPQPVFLLKLVQEYIDSGANMRERRPVDFKSSHHQSLKRPRAGEEKTLQIEDKCKGGHSSTSIKYLPYHKRSAHCAFCVRRRVMVKCRSCRTHLFHKNAR